MPKLNVTKFKIPKSSDYERTKLIQELKQLESKIVFDEFMDDYGDKSVNVLEIAAGKQVILAKRIAEWQKNHGGSITAIDETLDLRNKSNHLNCIKGHFDANHDVSPYDVLLGNGPCDAILDMIYSATSNNKELFLRGCVCPGLDLGMRAEEWYDIVERAILYNLPPNFIYEKVTNEEMRNCPFFKTRSRKIY